MRNVLRPISPLHPASLVMALFGLSARTRVALLLVFFLSTHAFWCGVGTFRCLKVLQAPISGSSLKFSSPSKSNSIGQNSIAQNVVSHDNHAPEDVCEGSDETRNRAETAASAFVPPLLLWVTIVFVATALTLVSLVHRAEVFGRDGPVSVPPLRSRFVRTSLPHRAPPVLT